MFVEADALQTIEPNTFQAVVATHTSTEHFLDLVLE